MIVVLLVIGAVVTGFIVVKVRRRVSAVDPVVGLTFEARPRVPRHKPARVYLPNKGIDLR